MKKIFSIITVFLSVCLQGFAQQYINLYQDDVVIKQYSTEEIDSMSVSETEPRIVSFWRDGSVFQTYNAADIDSIKVSFTIKDADNWETIDSTDLISVTLPEKSTEPASEDQKTK